MTTTRPGGQPIDAEMVAFIVALADGEPQVLGVRDAPRLPSGPLLASHRSLQASVRAWVERQTGHTLGYLEQLYTFADSDRGTAQRHVSVSYLGLTDNAPRRGDVWHGWYDVLPWEDTRTPSPLVSDVIRPRLDEWVAGASGTDRVLRRERCDVVFGLGDAPWDADLALQRYELLYEAGLVPESPDDWRRDDALLPGTAMDWDHRRIVATGVARLRAKIQYRPVVFQLLPDEFTLGQLQSCVEAIAGRHVHTQNFRRQVEKQALVEETGALDHDTGGRPARLYRFRQDVIALRRATGTKLPTTRAH